MRHPFNARFLIWKIPFSNPPQTVQSYFHFISNKMFFFSILSSHVLFQMLRGPIYWLVISYYCTLSRDDSGLIQMIIKTLHELAFRIITLLVLPCQKTKKYRVQLVVIKYLGIFQILQDIIILFSYNIVFLCVMTHYYVCI